MEKVFGQGKESYIKCPFHLINLEKKSFPLKICCHSPKLSNTRGGEGDTFYGKKALVKINALPYPFQLICLSKYTKAMAKFYV